MGDSDTLATIASSLADRYQIERPLGEGGMATVYLAQDLKHHRAVAVKVLKPDLAASLGAERFLREIETTARLTHPHILPLLDSGAAGGLLYYVMPYVAGESLRARLQQGGPLPIAEAVRLVRGVAGALGYAHAHGVVHRDIKPENILLAGHEPLVADFGIARAVSSASGRLTQTGISVGTPAYMSPEQASGEPNLDGRSDLYSLGCVFYELLAGEPPFTGPNAQAVTARKLSETPRPLTAVRATVPPAVELVVQRLLALLPADRYATADALVTALDAAQTPTGTVVQEVPWSVRASRWGRALASWRTAAIMAAGVAAWALWSRGPVVPRGVVTRLAMPVQQLAVLEHAGASAVALSPDGSRIAFVVGDTAVGQLYIRRLDMTEAEPVKGATEAFSPFWSPDGAWLGFVNAGKLIKVRIADGHSVVLADVRGINALHGATMRTDGTVVVAGGGALEWGILRIPPEGGKPELLVAPDRARSEVYLCWPTFLPDGKTVLYTAVSGNGLGFEVVALSLEDKRRTVVTTGPLGNVKYVAPGYLVFQQGGTLSAVRFDPSSLRVSGSPIRMLLDPLWMLPGEPAISHFDVAPNGTLVYLSNGGRQPRGRMLWVDRTGREDTLPDLELRMGDDTLSGLGFGRISPDGRQLAFVHLNYVSSTGRLPERDVWVFDLDRGTLSRHPSRTLPMWMPDGERLLMGATRDSAYGHGLVIQRVDGAGAVEEVLPFQAGSEAVPGAMTRDGRRLLYHIVRAESDIWSLDLKRGTREVLIGSPERQRTPTLSPDGRWLAYASLETGRSEVYLTDFPARERRWQLTAQGGMSPAWGPDGREIFFEPTDGSRGLWRVGLGSGATPVPGVPSQMFSGSYARGGPYGRGYDVAPDGRRFLMDRPPDFSAARGQLNVVLNWTTELRERFGR